MDPSANEASQGSKVRAAPSPLASAPTAACSTAPKAAGLGMGPGTGPDAARPADTAPLTDRAPSNAPRIAKLVQPRLLQWRLPPLRFEAAELLDALLPLESGAGGWNSEGFLEAETALASAKKRFDTIPAAAFEELMRALDLYRGLKDTFRDRFGMTVATNASLKMYELLSQLHLLPCGPEESAPGKGLTLGAGSPQALRPPRKGNIKEESASEGGSSWGEAEPPPYPGGPPGPAPPPADAEGMDSFLEELLQA